MLSMDVQSNQTVDIARRLAQLGQTDDARRAYALALHQLSETGDQPKSELEAALYLLQNGGDYRVAYTAFVRLYQRGFDRRELLELITGAFYTPNVKQLKSRYEKNCRLLEKYPYLFRKDFPAFEDLPIQFFPFDDKGYLPFEKGEFGEYVNFNYPKITRNFFKDLDKPILAEDVFSAYELRYLKDNVRKSEWVARENHIYLHYTDWGAFCAHLQLWNLKPLLEEKKFVFLIEDEISQYPIDFKARFGIDYSKYPLEPFHIREINRLIWHTQLSAHNGGDFFNEIFDGHPNLITLPSMMMENVEESVQTVRDCLHNHGTLVPRSPAEEDKAKHSRLAAELNGLKNITDKDILVFIFLVWADLNTLDPNSRISPAIFFQPHFSNITYDIHGRGDVAVLHSNDYEKVKKSPMFTEFPYIKTFTPMRRPTTSCAATVKFQYGRTLTVRDDDGKKQVVCDVVVDRLLNRSYLLDPQDRLYQDSVLVRFEDGKLNPRATFTALAAFLDIPYTESMTYCSWAGVRDPESLEGNARGFDPARLYATYDEYLGRPERYFLEYFMRDAYEAYGYDFNYYDGEPVDKDRVKELAGQFDTLAVYLQKSWRASVEEIVAEMDLKDPTNKQFAGMSRDEIVDEVLQDKMKGIELTRIKAGEVLLRGLRFVNHWGQPLQMMPKLQLDPALLDQPLYH
jgi:hypothetical protein